MLRVFEAFQRERSLADLAKGISLKKAQDYYPALDDPDHARKNDAPWIRRFAADGGKVVISGNTKMQTVPHERLALVQTGLVTIFFDGKWSGWKFCRKCSLLMHWWPVILDTTKKGRPGFYMVPMAWPEEGRAKLKVIPTADLKLEKIERQLAAREGIQRERQQRREATALGDLFDDRPEA